jgi:hypothetical protein
MTRRAALAVAAACLLPAPLPAQNLSDQIVKLFTFGTCGEPLCLDGSQLVGHGDHFIPAQAAGTGSVISFIENAIGQAVANIPISAASSGVTYRFEGGVPVKTSTSAGPIFAERAQTLGRGRFFIGVNVTGQHFERIRGVSLENLSFNFGHQDVTPVDSLGDPGFENDLIQVQVAMNVDLLVTTAFASWGIVDGVDIGVAVPFVHTSLNGSSVAEVLPIGSGAATPHYFGTDPQGNPILNAVSSASGSATGIGDVAGRLKINVAQSQKVGVAVLGEARFPTGKREDLLGAGAFAARGLGIVSMRFGDFSPHANVGYVFRDDTLSNNGVLGTLGFDHLLGSWATLAVDWISEWQVGDSKVAIPAPLVYDSPYRREVAVTTIPDQKDNYMSLSVGFKFTTGRGMTFVANGLFPLSDGGVQPSAVWTGGLEYNF